MPATAKDGTPASAPKRDRPWLFRTYSGHSSAKASNALYHMNLKAGQTGLSVAFDLPTQTGYDSDHRLARGEVGKVGVPIGHLGDLEALFEGIPLAEMNTSMTINAPAAWPLSALCGSIAVAGGYLFVARIPLDSFWIWFFPWELAKLLAMSLALFASFAAIGVLVASLLSRAGERVGRLYCVDLLGAGLGCAVVVPLIGSVGPPATIFLAGSVLAVSGVRLA